MITLFYKFVNMKQLWQFLIVLLIIPAMISCSNTQFPKETFVTPAGEDLEITLISHGSVALSYRGYEIYVDPVSKMDDKTIDFESFPKADLVLITHDHYDHLDEEAVDLLCKEEETRIISNPDGFEKLGWGEAIENGGTTDINGSITLKAVPAYNITEGHTQFHPKGRDNGYLLDFDGFKVYISGDTEDIEELAELKGADVALLSTNQPYTMTPEQCGRAVRAIEPKTVIPYHMGDTDFDTLRKVLEGYDVRLHEEAR